MALKLAIDNVVGVKVEGKTSTKDGAEKPFKFILECERLSADEMKDVLADKDETLLAFFEKRARGWQKQTLVLEDDGTAAAFSIDALRLLLGISGMALLCWQCYLAQVQATGKN